MSEGKYPILVELLTGDQALVIVCQSCNAEMTIGAEDIRNEEDYGCARCGGWAVYKYVEADHKCPNCGELGFFSAALEHCCSRSCMLQAEYAKTLTVPR